MAGLFNHTISLAKAVLRTNAAADFWESVGRLRDIIGLFKAARCGHQQPVGDVVVQRTVRLAVGYATLRAAAGLFGGLLGRKLAVDLIEILLPVVGGPLFRHVTRDVHKLQHRLLSHKPYLIPYFAFIPSSAGSCINKDSNTDLITQINPNQPVIKGGAAE